MARIPTNASGADVASINLTRLLARLQDTILKPDAATQRRLTSSSYERSKVGSNLDYARTLLLRLEQDSVGIKVQSRKQDFQTDLLQKRDLIERLGERLQEFEELDDGTNGTSDEEDLIGENTPPEEPEEEEHQEEPEEPISQQFLHESEGRDSLNPSHTSQREQLFSTDSNSTLRSRNIQSGAQATDTARTTSSSTSAPLTTSEVLLTHNRTEQESLTESLLSMAQKLKESSHAFSESLESEKDILGRAVEGLDKNQIGMEAAQKRMGYLRSMTEGRGWLGRMMMYAWIAALMIIAILIVGVMPKLRF